MLVPINGPHFAIGGEWKCTSFYILFGECTFMFAHVRTWFYIDLIVASETWQQYGYPTVSLSVGFHRPPSPVDLHNSGHCAALLPGSETAESWRSLAKLAGMITSSTRLQLNRRIVQLIAKADLSIITWSFSGGNQALRAGCSRQVLMTDIRTCQKAISSDCLVELFLSFVPPCGRFNEAATDRQLRFLLRTLGVLFPDSWCAVKFFFISSSNLLLYIRDKPLSRRPGPIVYFIAFVCTPPFRLRGRL